MNKQKDEQIISAFTKDHAETIEFAKNFLILQGRDETKCKY